MKTIFLSLILLFSCYFTASAQNIPLDVSIKTTDGKQTVLAEYLNDSIPLIITFWSTSCKPCLQELEAINDAWDEWQAAGVFKVIAVSIDDARSAAKVAPMASARRWPFTVLIDSNEDLKRAMNVTLSPTSFVVDKRGKIVFTHIGYTRGSEDSLFEALQQTEELL